MIIIAALLFCSFVLIGYFNDRNVKIFFAILFVILSFLLKFSIDETRTADYPNYVYVITLDRPDFSFKSLFNEPYFFQLGSWLYKHFTAAQSMSFYTEASFICSTVFFIWLAFLKNISTFNKIVVFSLYYCFFAYIVYRNAPAYMLSGVSFYYLHRNKYLKSTVLLFLAHLSSVPVIIFSLFKNKLGDKKLVIICLLLILSFNILIRIELFGIYNKYHYYSTQTKYGFSIFHIVYFYAFVLLNIYLFYIRKDIIYNYTYLLLFTTYLILNYSNAVMGYRFSIYLILYLMINPKLCYSKKAKHKLLFVAPLFFGLFILNYLILEK